MDLLKHPRNRNYVIAGIGAIVAFLSFLILPFATYSMSSSITGQASGVSSSLTGSQVAGAGGGILWLSILLLLGVIAASALFIFRSNNPFGITTVPLAKQARWVAYAFIGIGALSALVGILAVSGLNQSYGSSLLSISVGMGFGSIIFIIASIAVVVAGVLAVRAKAPVDPVTGYAAQYQYPPTQYPPQAPGQYPSTQYPPQAGQYPPQAPGQYPSGQYPPQAPGQYPSTQYPPQAPNQYPPQAQGQYPPSQYPPQQ